MGKHGKTTAFSNLIQIDKRIILQFYKFNFQFIIISDTRVFAFFLSCFLAAAFADEDLSVETEIVRDPKCNLSNLEILKHVLLII